MSVKKKTRSGMILPDALAGDDDPSDLWEFANPHGFTDLDVASDEEPPPPPRPRGRPKGSLSKHKKKTRKRKTRVRIKYVVESSKRRLRRKARESTATIDRFLGKTGLGLRQKSYGATLEKVLKDIRQDMGMPEPEEHLKEGEGLEMLDTRSRAYMLGEDEGYAAAKKESIHSIWWIDPNDRSAEEWFDALISRLGPFSAGKTLGVVLYANGALTADGAWAAVEYNAGATAGWNRRVEEIEEEKK